MGSLIGIRKEERKKRACRKSGERRGEEGEKMKENFRRQVIFFFVISKVRYNIAQSLLLKDCFSFFFIHIFLQNWLTQEFLFCSSVCIRMNVAGFWNICRCYLIFIAYHMLCIVPKQN
jgi:hypothetical protein